MATGDLLGAALALSPEQRERLADELQISVAHDRGHDTTIMPLDPELTAEFDRRIAALDGGEAGTVTLQEAEARVMRRLATVWRR